eukprot:6490270-Amphidinium_carterae.4
MVEDDESKSPAGVCKSVFASMLYATLNFKFDGLSNGMSHPGNVTQTCQVYWMSKSSMIPRR